MRTKNILAAAVTAGLSMAGCAEEISPKPVLSVITPDAITILDAQGDARSDIEDVFFVPDIEDAETLSDIKSADNENTDMQETDIQETGTGDATAKPFTIIGSSKEIQYGKIFDPNNMPETNMPCVDDNMQKKEVPDFIHLGSNRPFQGVAKTGNAENKAFFSSPDANGLNALPYSVEEIATYNYGAGNTIITATVAAGSEISAWVQSKTCEINPNTAFQTDIFLIPLKADTSDKMDDVTDKFMQAIKTSDANALNNLIKEHEAGYWHESGQGGIESNQTNIMVGQTGIIVMSIPMPSSASCTESSADCPTGIQF